MTTCFISENTITTVIKGKSKITDLNSDLGKALLDLYNKDELHLASDLISSHEIIDNLSVKQGDDGNMIIDGVTVDADIAYKIREIKNQGLPFDNLVNFAKKVNNNPSYNSRQMLYKFLKHNGHPICKNGNFIAYKKVSNEFKDLRTHTFDNSIGMTVTIPRSQVDDNPNNTCSSGLHVASFGYAEDFGRGKLVMVEVNPENVVAVPTDYDGTKMRVCEYVVICETDKSLEGVYKADDSLAAGDYFTIDNGFVNLFDQILCENVTFKVNYTYALDGEFEIENVDTGECFDVYLSDLENNITKVK